MPSIEIFTFEQRSGDKYVYYMHNKEIWRFLNKLKAIITSGLRRFISSKEIFPPSRFYFSNAIVLC